MESMQGGLHSRAMQQLRHSALDKDPRQSVQMVSSLPTFLPRCAVHARVHSKPDFPGLHTHAVLGWAHRPHCSPVGGCWTRQRTQTNGDANSCRETWQVCLPVGQ
jgi:hypothetical protein